MSTMSCPPLFADNTMTAVFLGVMATVISFS
jgi:hypothetical protein